MFEIVQNKQNKNIEFIEFELKVILHNGQAYEAVLPVEHCPKQSGCRSLIRQADGNNKFSLTENFLLSLQVLLKIKYTNLILIYIYTILKY